jgi:hypothetical protein
MLEKDGVKMALQLIVAIDLDQRRFLAFDFFDIIYKDRLLNMEDVTSQI